MVCIHRDLLTAAGTAAPSRRCSAAHSDTKRGLWPRPGGWRYGLASRPAKPRLPAPADTGWTPPDRTAAEERKFGFTWGCVPALIN